jgi:hypothetical protein
MASAAEIPLRPSSKTTPSGLLPTSNSNSEKVIMPGKISPQATQYVNPRGVY